MREKALLMPLLAALSLIIHLMFSEPQKVECGFHLAKQPKVWNLSKSLVSSNLAWKSSLSQSVSWAIRYLHFCSCWKSSENRASLSNSTLPALLLGRGEMEKAFPNISELHNGLRLTPRVHLHSYSWLQWGSLCRHGHTRCTLANSLKTDMSTPWHGLQYQLCKLWPFRA